MFSFKGKGDNLTVMGTCHSWTNFSQQIIKKSLKHLENDTICAEEKIYGSSFFSHRKQCNWKKENNVTDKIELF